MTINQSRGTHVSRYLANLRIERDLKPGQLAAILQARNISKIGSLIRQFELNGETSSYWMEKLITVLNPDKEALEKCIALDKENYLNELENQKIKWEKWASISIDPSLTIRYIPAVYVTRDIPKAFTSSREDAEWWAAKELKRFRSNGYLNWTRKEQTFYKKDGTISSRHKATFESPPASAWMKVSGSSIKFLLQQDFTPTTKSQTIKEARP